MKVDNQSARFATAAALTINVMITSLAVAMLVALSNSEKASTASESLTTLGTPIALAAYFATAILNMIVSNKSYHAWKETFLNGARGASFMLATVNTFAGACDAIATKPLGEENVLSLIFTIANSFTLFCLAIEKKEPATKNPIMRIKN